MKERMSWAAGMSIFLPGAVFFGEEDVVVGVGVEGRIKVDQVHRFVVDVAAEDVEVVAVVEDVGLHSRQ